MRRHVRQRRERRRPGAAAPHQDRPQGAAIGKRARGEVADQTRDGRHRQRAVVDIRGEPALGQDRLVEQADARRDQAVDRAGQREDPERRRPQRLAERRAERRRRDVCASGASPPSTSRPMASGDDRSKSQASGARPKTRHTPIAAHAVRQPLACTSAPTSGKRRHEADAHHQRVDGHRAREPRARTTCRPWPG